jgi:hypothetical protein
MVMCSIPVAGLGTRSRATRRRDIPTASQQQRRPAITDDGVLQPKALALGWGCMAPDVRTVH